ncbi:hypothetical protein HOLleu_00425 [Holothuria leucospilota]|uniref:Uncharacterized protein n=1 Tax=Holothuria leucospilota TaxID=206669 RepID=A0A9Q1HIP6_HOLLE|nr:hypothetical protein HOLleu_00425 [Holothuria leucospilota]
MAKKARTFLPTWRDDYGFVPQQDRAVCVLCLENVVCRIIKEIPTSARTVQRLIEEMAENVNSQQTAGLKNAPVFSVALDESVDVNDMPRLAVMAKYCDSTVRELCCLKPMPDTIKGADVAKVYLDR